MGDALVADVKLTIEALLEAVPASDRTPPQPLDPPLEVELTDPIERIDGDARARGGVPRERDRRA